MGVSVYTFGNLVKTSTICCEGTHVFKDTNVISFFYSYVFTARRSHRPDAVGALRDIAYTQRDNIDEHTFNLMCKVFLNHAPRSLLNRAIRNIFWCLGVRLRNLGIDEDTSYLELLQNVDAAHTLLSERRRLDDVQRAAMVVLISNEYLHDKIDTYLHTHADEKLWTLAIASGMFSLSGAPPAIQDNEKAVLATIRSYVPSEFHAASPRIRAKRSIGIEAVRKEVWLLEDLSEELRDDLEVVQIAVMRKGGTLRYASERLRGNRQLALLAFSDLDVDWFLTPLYAFLSDDLKDDEEVALSSLQYGARGQLRYVSERLRHLRTFVLAAVRRDGWNLEFVPQFQDDDEIVMIAVSHRNSGDVLQFASPRLQDDYSIVLAAVLHGGLALRFASPNLKDNYRIVKKAFDVEQGSLRFASERLQALLIN